MNPFGEDVSLPSQPIEDNGLVGFSLVLETYHTRTEPHAVVPEGVTQILPQAFKGHAELECITLPKTLQSIGDEAFAGCVSLREVRVPAAVFEIGKRAFAGCVSLERACLPEGLLMVEESLFQGCSRLREVLGGNEVDAIEAAAFSGCTELAELALLARARVLGSGALAGCALCEVVFPQVMECIGSEAFRSCQLLSRVVMPQVVGTLGKDVFLGCFSLRSVEGLEDLAPAFPHAFPRSLVEGLGIMRPQDFKAKAREFKRLHAAEADEVRATVETHRAAMRSLKREQAALGAFDRTRKKEIGAQLEARRNQIGQLNARLEALENPTWEQLAVQVKGARPLL